MARDLTPVNFQVDNVGLRDQVKWEPHDGIWCIPSSDTSTYDPASATGGWGSPFLDANFNKINGGLGTINGEDPQVLIFGESGSRKVFRSFNSDMIGEVVWDGQTPDGDEVKLHIFGTGHLHALLLDGTPPAALDYVQDNYSTLVYRNNRLVGDAPKTINGATLYWVNGIEYLFVISGAGLDGNGYNEDYVYRKRLTPLTPQEKAQGIIDYSNIPDQGWDSLPFNPYNDAYRFMGKHFDLMATESNENIVQDLSTQVAHWSFNDAGNEAVCLYQYTYAVSGSQYKLTAAILKFEIYSLNVIGFSLHQEITSTETNTVTYVYTPVQEPPPDDFASSWTSSKDEDLSSSAIVAVGYDGDTIVTLHHERVSSRDGSDNFDFETSYTLTDTFAESVNRFIFSTGEVFNFPLTSYSISKSYSYAGQIEYPPSSGQFVEKYTLDSETTTHTNTRDNITPGYPATGISTEYQWLGPTGIYIDIKNRVIVFTEHVQDSTADETQFAFDEREHLYVIKGNSTLANSSVEHSDTIARSDPAVYDFYGTPLFELPSPILVPFNTLNLTDSTSDVPIEYEPWGFPNKHGFDNYWESVYSGTYDAIPYPSAAVAPDGEVYTSLYWPINSSSYNFTSGVAADELDTVTSTPGTNTQYFFLRRW